MTVLSQYPRTDTIWHSAFPCPDIDAAIDFYCNELGCKFHRKFVVHNEEHKPHKSFIMSMAGHHIVVMEGETSVPQPNGRTPRHNGPIFFNKEEYFEVIEHVKNNPKINVIDSKYYSFIPKKIAEEDKENWGQNVRVHMTHIKDPWDNWIEFKCYSYEDQIYS